MAMLEGALVNGAACLGADLAVSKEDRGWQDLVGRRTAVPGRIVWGGSVRLSPERLSVLRLGQTVRYQGPIVDWRGGDRPLRWCTGELVIHEVLDSAAGEVEVSGLGVPERHPTPGEMEALRLLGAARSEIEHGGDGVPDLLSAVVALGEGSRLARDAERLLVLHQLDAGRAELAAAEAKVDARLTREPWPVEPHLPTRGALPPRRGEGA